MSWITKNWIARYLKPGHKFKIGNNIWELSGNPINEAEYEDFSRAVYECKLVDERGGEEIKSPAVVKIWMQTPEINTYEDWFYASELYDLYLAENLDTAGDPDIDIASHMGSPEQFVSAGNSDIASDSNFAGHSNPADKSDSDGHSDITNHPNSNTHSNSTYNSDINSATHPIPALNSQSPSNSNSNSNPNPNTTNLINPPNYPEPWDSELTCLNLLNKSYTTLHHTPNIPNTTNTSAQEKSKIPSDTYKPFPYAIGLAKYKQRRNFPLEGGYLVYLVMEKLPGECIYPGVFWGGWDRCERDRFRGAFGVGVLIFQKLGIENRDKAMRNLLYDRENGKCYFIDWEAWRYRNEEAWPPLPLLEYSYDLIRHRDRGDEGENEERWDRG